MSDFIHTKPFGSNDTVRNNPYMKKISNQKHQFIKKIEAGNFPDLKVKVSEIKDMELNDFKKQYEISQQTNQSLDQIFRSELKQEPETTTTDTNKPDPKLPRVKTIQEPIEETIDQPETEPVTEMNHQPDQLHAKTKSIKIIEPNYLTLLNATKETYHQRSDELKQLDLAFDREYKKGVLFVGGSGVGKTLMCLYYATIRKLPCVFMSCHSGITKDELIGSYQLVDNNSAYVLGEIIQAIICANNNPNKRSILILDELNTLTSDTQKILNEMLRFKDGIVIPELGIKYRLNAGCQVLVLATSNPLSYQGTNELNAELESRFEIIPCPDLSSEELRELVSLKYDLDPELLENLIRLKEIIVEANRDGKLDKGFDTREFVKLIDQYVQLRNNKFSHDKALVKSVICCLYGKFTISDDEDQARFVSETIESTLAIQRSNLNWFD